MPSATFFRTSSLPVRSRREFLRTAAATGALAAATFALPRRAFAKTQVNWLGWQGYDQPLQTEGFLEKAGIELAATYLANNDEIVTKLAANAPIDIVTPYMGYVPGLREAGFIQSVDTSKVPNLPKVLPLFREDSNLFVDGVHWSVPITWGGGPMVYDPAVLTPTSWFDLEKPEYKGKIAMFDDAVGMMLTASIMVSGAETASLVTAAQLEEVKKYCIKLKKEHARATLAGGYPTGCSSKRLAVDLAHVLPQVRPVKFYLAYRTCWWHNAAPDASRLPHPALLPVSHRCRAGQMVYLSAEGA